MLFLSPLLLLGVNVPLLYSSYVYTHRGGEYFANVPTRKKASFKQPPSCECVHTHASEFSCLFCQLFAFLHERKRKKGAFSRTVFCVSGLHTYCIVPLFIRWVTDWDVVSHSGKKGGRNLLYQMQISRIFTIFFGWESPALGQQVGKSKWRAYS